MAAAKEQIETLLTCLLPGFKKQDPVELGFDLETDFDINDDENASHGRNSSGQHDNDDTEDSTCTW